MMTEAERSEFRRRMSEYDQAHGIHRPAAAPAGESEDPPLPSDTYGTVKAARAEWEQSPAIRAEFTCLEAYMAFKKAEARGAVRIISRKA